LYSEDLYLIGLSNPAQTSAEEVDLADLHGVPLVIPGERSNLRSLISRSFAARGFVPTVGAEVESHGSLLHIARSGEACTILPSSTVTALGSSADLAVRRIVRPVIDRHVAVCTTAEFYEPREAVAAVQSGIVEVTTRLATQQAWPGIRLAS